MTKRLCDICHVEIHNQWFSIWIEQQAPMPSVTKRKSDEVCAGCVDRVIDAMRAPPRDAEAVS